MTTSYAPADPVLLHALDRLILTRLGPVIEAEVQGSDGDTYRVRIDGFRWACSCPAAIYGGRKADACKHARALRLIRRTLPPALGGTPKSPRSTHSNERN